MSYLLYTMDKPKQTPNPKPPLQAVAEEEQRTWVSQHEVDERMQRINEDFQKGFQLLREHRDTVTFFGSSRLTPDHEHYQLARRLAQRTVREIGSTIVTGGGRGIMSAANQGASEADGESIGMSIELPCEQVTNQYVDESIDFYYFFSRKVALSFTARAYIYFPGGFGTLDEFFEILTLKQTQKIAPIPIILIGSHYWQPLLHFIETTLRDEYDTIGDEDTQLYFLTDDEDEVIQAIAAYETNG